jgi:hypothetical protein
MRNEAATSSLDPGGAWIARVRRMEAIAWIIAAAVIAGVIGYTMKRKRQAHE